MVLKEEYEGQLEPDEAQFNAHVIDDDVDLDYDLGKAYIRESAASPSAANVDGDGKGENQTKNNVIVESTGVTGNQGAGMSVTALNYFIYRIAVTLLLLLL